MIETTIRNYLAGALDGVPVFLEMPETPSARHPHIPDTFVLIERIAGGKSEQIHTASLALQSYSRKSLYEAASLDEQVRDAMDDFDSLENIGAVRLSSNYNFTDTETKFYRYQAVYDVVYLR